MHQTWRMYLVEVHKQESCIRNRQCLEGEALRIELLHDPLLRETNDSLANRGSVMVTGGHQTSHARNTSPISVDLAP